MKTNDELLALIREEGPWTVAKGDAALELLRREADLKEVAIAIRAGTPSYCEHGHPWVEHCIACDGEFEEEEL